MNNNDLSKFQTYYKNNSKEKLTEKELAEAIECLGTEDEKFKAFIGELILNQGEKSLPALLQGSRHDERKIRRGSIFLINKLVKKQLKLPIGDILSVMHANLDDEDAKIRKNSAVILGNLKQSESASYLISALEKEELFWVRSSIILALGAIGDDEVKAFFSDYKSKGEPEEEALEKVLDKLVGARSQLQVKDQLEKEIPIELWTFAGLEPILANDLKKNLNLQANRIRAGILSTTTKDLTKLFSIRSFTEFLISFGSSPIETEAQIPAKVSELFTTENLEMLTAIYKNDFKQIRYRIEVRGEDLKHKDRQKILRKVKGEVKNHSPQFFNSPSEYDIEMRIVVEKTAFRLLWKPYSNLDTRFNYRVGDIPASIHPAAAAGILGFNEYQNTGNYRVLDPFCGSGTMLVERAERGKYQELVGVDLSKNAIKVAKQNLKATDIKNVHFVHSDIRAFSDKQKFNEVIANMPFGLRVGDHKHNLTLYTEFFNLLPDLLEKEGSVLLYTQEINLTKRLFKESKFLRLKSVDRVVTGGLKPAIFIGERI